MHFVDPSVQSKGSGNGLIISVISLSLEVRGDRTWDIVVTVDFAEFFLVAQNISDVFGIEYEAINCTNIITYQLTNS